MVARLRVTQVKSTIGHIARNRGTIRALGLRRIGDTVEIPDNAATRGMVRQVRFLVSVESLGGERSSRASAEAAVPAETAEATASPTEAAAAAESAEPSTATARPATPSTRTRSKAAKPAAGEQA
jgi:large subunit ribosomal protein L30